MIHNVLLHKQLTAVAESLHNILYNLVRCKHLQTQFTKAEDIYRMGHKLVSLIKHTILNLFKQIIVQSVFIGFQ